MGRKYFLIASNGRTGSSWLQTSLAVLPDVAADYEFKWHPTLYEPQSIHMVIPDGSFSSRAALDQFSADACVVGSKLTLDAHEYLGPGIIEQLGQAIEREIAIVHLTRNYFDTMLSWRARQVYNVLADPDESRITGTMMLPVMKDLTTNHDPTVNSMCVVRGRIDRWLLDRARQAPKAPSPGTTITYDKNASIPFDHVVNYLLILFYNDLICRELANRASRTMFLKYGEIESRFGEVAKIVGSEAGAAEIEAVRSNPVTRRLGGLGPDLVRHADAVLRVARCLDEAMDDVIASDKRLEDVWTWSTDHRSAIIHVPGLRAAVARGRSLLPIPVVGFGRPLEWPCKAI